MTKSVALCMIVKDEQEGLERAISSAAPWVDEVIVVDTGSTDDTVGIAQRAGASVHQFEFTDGIDFGAARTRSIKLANADWALLLDGDTTLDPASGPILGDIALACSDPPVVAGALWKNYLGPDKSHLDVYTPGMLPLATGRRMVGRRHSLFVDSDGPIFPSRFVKDLVVHHWGFSIESLLTNRKMQANEELTLLQIEETPEYSPFWIDAIRAHRSDDKAAKGLELVDRFKKELESGGVRFVHERTPFQVAYYEALVAFGADNYDQAFRAADCALKTAPSRDMFAVTAAVDAVNGRDREAVKMMLAAAAIADDPHPLTGRAEGTYITSKMYCHIARAAERVGDIQHAMDSYTNGMSTIPTFEQGPHGSRTS